MSVSTENFIKSIYKIKVDEQSRVTTTRLAEMLNISKAAISDMARKLGDENYIIYEPYKEIELTAKGRSMALNVIRKHRLWESFLHEVFGLNTVEVHREAEELEHKTSDFLSNKIEEYLNFPAYDPHGDPIPDRFGNMPVEKEFNNLHQGTENTTYEISRLNIASDEMAEFFKLNKLEVGTKIKLVKKLHADDSIFIESGNMRIVISKFIGNNIFIH